MEMCRGVSTATVSERRPQPSMDTSSDRCSCPQQVTNRPDNGPTDSRIRFSIWNSTDFSEWKMYFPCCLGKHAISKIRRRYLTPFLQSMIGDFIKYPMCSKSILVILLIVLNFLIVGATPTHKVRHRHYRNVLHSDRLCDSPGVIDQPTHDQCSTMAARARRDVNTMTLREGQASSLCAYSVCVDEDANRRPVHIHRVYCLQSGCRCTQQGAYRCTQLYNKMEVWYPSTNASQMLDIEYGCVCAAKHGSSVDPFVPDTGDK